ncbi:MAG: hypothetical protein ACKO3N_20600 [Verrucomicrobiota bacterium]
MKRLSTGGGWASLLLALGLAGGAGCRKSPSGSAAAAAAPPEAASGEAPATGATVPGAGAEVGGVAALRALAQGVADPYVRNNAKAAADAWDRGAYVDAVVFLKTMLTLPQARAHAAAIQSALGGMIAELDSAATRGNAPAKEALEQLRVPDGTTTSPSR